MVHLSKKYPALCESQGGGTPVLALQGFQQRLGLLEIRRVPALGEPAVDGRQERTRFGPFALLLPQTGGRGSWRHVIPTTWPAAGEQ